MLTSAFDVDEINALIRLLHRQGVSYLMGNDSSSAQEKETARPVRLLQRLAACNYPLVENATISLLLLHPEPAPSVKTAFQDSEPELAENLAVVTLAAYLVDVQVRPVFSSSSFTCSLAIWIDPRQRSIAPGDSVQVRYDPQDTSRIVLL